ncbi:MAG TPA: hypothetical protein VEF04_07640, partial [Blastocatellia bacterium]|nr:hypothetical protein [Blastocatellia bacterium]
SHSGDSIIATSKHVLDVDTVTIELRLREDAASNQLSGFIRLKMRKYLGANAWNGLTRTAWLKDIRWRKGGSNVYHLYQHGAHIDKYMPRLDFEAEYYNAGARTLVRSIEYLGHQGNGKFAITFYN